VPACGGGRAERSRARDERGGETTTTRTRVRTNARASERGDSLARAYAERARVSTTAAVARPISTTRCWSSPYPRWDRSIRGMMRPRRGACADDPPIRYLFRVHDSRFYHFPFDPRASRSNLPRTTKPRSNPIGETFQIKTHTNARRHIDGRTTRDDGFDARVSPCTQRLHHHPTRASSPPKASSLLPSTSPVPRV
jgi:hypothetical protein